MSFSIKFTEGVCPDTDILFTNHRAHYWAE